MNNTIVFDLETDGLLEDLTKIHLLTLHHPDGATSVYRRNDEEDTIRVGLEFLQSTAQRGGIIAGHNVIAFDIPAIKKLYSWFDVPMESVFDTLVIARVIWAHIIEFDAANRFPKLPKNMWSRHSLEAWGYRLGEMKGEYQGDTRIADIAERKKRKWERWNPDMEAYGIQDVVVTRKLLNLITKKNYSKVCLDLEHETAWLCAQLERNGWPFNSHKAGILQTTLVKRKLELERELKETFASWEIDLPDFIPKRNNKTKGFIAGVPVPRKKTIEFNPGSRDHIANRLITLYGWKPTEFGADGKPTVDEEVLEHLKYPPIPLLNEYLMVTKRLGQLAEGKKAWLLFVTPEGRIHGRINPNGTVTGRAAHSNPNLGQVPNSKAPYGPECRDLFEAPAGWVMVGADTSGLELRCLAHYMARWDDGAYREVLLTGDVHEANRAAAGLPTRDNAKTFIYGWLYGAGDEKIGKIVGKGKVIGRKLKANFLQKLPALASLKTAVTSAAGKKKIKGLDGRILFVRSPHSALNTLLQSAGAIVCKRWITYIERHLTAAGLRHGWQGDYCFLGWIHDEVQIACRPEHAEKIAEICKQAAVEAGVFFNLRCPIAGEAKVGKSWKETH